MHANFLKEMAELDAEEAEAEAEEENEELEEDIEEIEHELEGIGSINDDMEENLIDDENLDEKIPTDAKEETIPAPVNETNNVTDTIEDNFIEDLGTVTNLREKQKENIALDRSNAEMFANKLNAFNTMYGTNLDADKFGETVWDSWNLIGDDDASKVAAGKKMLGNLFKETLKNAFDIEKGIAYDEHRLPEYAEIIRSANELLRAAMFAFTDLYHDPSNISLFDPTACGGLNAKEMAELTVGDSLWGMDQNSDKAWEIQSREAKNIANKWLSDDKPYEKMINEMNALVETNQKSVVDRKEILNKLAAAEWLLVNNEKMMIENPEDPLNPIPNWGNRYWKTLIQTREALGIDKHTSVRDLIQSDYAASSKAVCSLTYNERQINDYVLDPDVRGMYDSMDMQKEQFATQSAAVILNEPQQEKIVDELVMTSDRMQFTVESEDERKNMRNAVKEYNFIIDRQMDVKLEGPNQGL